MREKINNLIKFKKIAILKRVYKMQKKFLIYIAFLSLVFSFFIFRVSDLAYANQDRKSVV